MAQVNTNNFPIPNDTGANVLADINENLEALQTNNAGGSAPIVGRAHQFYVDESTSPDTLKIRGNADNAAFITLGNIETNMGMMPVTGGTFTGNIQTSAGSKVSPAIQLADANTGFFKPAADQIGFATGGEERGLIGATGLVISDNKEIRLNEQVSNGYSYVGIKAPAALSTSITLTLPSDDGNADEVLTTDGNGVLSFQPLQGVPTGTILAWAAAANQIPGGYLECNGDHVSAVTYNALGNLLGTAYNNGQTPPAGEFFLPDLRGQFIRGWGHGFGAESNRVRASKQLNSNKSHTHSVASASISNSGGDHGHAIRPIRLNQYNGGTDITLGQGQSYHISYSNNDNEGNITANNAVKNSGNFASSITSTLSLTLNGSGDTESRPDNIAMIYIIKT